MSNLDKLIYGISALEVIWEIIGLFSNIPTPGKGVARAVNWMFPDSKEIKEIQTLDEFMETIKNFAATKKSNTDDNDNVSNFINESFSIFDPNPSDNGGDINDLNELLGK